MIVSFNDMLSMPPVLFFFFILKIIIDQKDFPKGNNLGRFSQKEFNIKTIKI